MRALLGFDVRPGARARRRIRSFGWQDFANWSLRGVTTRSRLAAGEQDHVDIASYPRSVAYLRAGRFDLAKADFTAYATAHAGASDAARGRDCADQKSNSGDCAIPYPPPSNPMTDQLLDDAGRSLSGCEES